MESLRGKKIIVTALLFCCFAAKAQYVFTNLQKKDGLSGNNVLCSYKDQEGFMWFGTTTGLNRYDGSGFKWYKRLNKNAAALTDDIVSSIYGRDKNSLWVATKNGLFLFDKQQETFTPVIFTNGKSKSFSDIRIEKLLPDHQQRLWIATSQGLFILQQNKAVEVSLLYPTAALLNGIPLNAAALLTDHWRNGLWIGTYSGLFFLHFTNGQTWSAQTNPTHNILFHAAQIFSMALDNQGEMWISSNSNALGHYSFATNLVTDIKVWDINGFNKIFYDSKHNLWLSTYKGKIFVLNGQLKKSILPGDSPDSYKMCNNTFLDAYEDNEKNVWLAGPNGVSKLSASNYLQNIVTLPGNLFDPQLPDAVISSICEAGNNSVWVCKDDGLYLLNTETGISKRYALATTNQLYNRFFETTFINGRWWCSTGSGIQILDTVTGKFSSLPVINGDRVKHNSTNWILQDKTGAIWFAHWTDAVYRYDINTKTNTRITAISDRPEGIAPGTNSLCAFENEDGKLWFSNGENGIVIYNAVDRSFTTPPQLSKIVVNNICKDAQYLWLATSGRGLLKADANGQLIDSITINDGLSTSTIYEIAKDLQGRLWISGSEGIQYIDPVGKAVSKLNVDMGLPVHEANGALLIAGDRLYGSAVNKVVAVDLLAVAKSTSATAPLISGVSIFNKKIPFSLSHPVLHLQHDENFFQVEFSSLDHKEFTSLQYAYMLQGFDKEWLYCGRGQTAAYTNVPDGNYTFLVKCTNANGQWIEKTTAINIFIKPAFWKSNWFIALLSLLLAAVLWGLYRNRQKQIRQKQIEHTIDYFANSVYGENSVNEICWDIARNCIAQLQFEDCAVYLMDKHTGRLQQKAAYGRKNPRGHEIINPVEIEPGKGIVGAVVLTGKPLLVNDTTKDTRYIIDEEPRLSEMAVPVLHDGQVIGVIDAEHQEKHFFTAAHLKAVNTIASISANKIAEAIAETQAKENELKLLEINKMLAESQLMALRAQMNPHFVFNCLNSIQECIVTEKYGEASKYLNKFSKLFRMVLNNSGKNLVTVDEEKEVLELYIELEQMRFEKSFSCSITVDEELDTEEVLIPSMLLQPYVENALWHGLMHKEGERILHINFEKINEEVFRCTIADNGIGRKKSFELKAQQSKTKRHESKGLKISEDRINVLQKQGYAASLRIIDNYDDEKNATGTTVIIELSTFLKS